MSVFERAPVYLQLVEKLRRDLEAQRLGSPGDLISARDIARQYQLSRDTVNKAMGELQALGYVTRCVGRGFIVQQSPKAGLSRQIGVVATYAQPGQDGFYGQIMQGLEHTCRELGFLVTWLGAGADGKVDVPYLQGLLAHRRVDGLVFLAVEDTALLNHFVGTGVPVVAVDYHDAVLQCDAVALDHAQGCDLAVEDLMQAGWERYAIVVRGSLDDYPSSQRLAGYRQALAARGVALPEARVFRVDETHAAEGGARTSQMMAERYLAIADACGADTAFLTAYAYHAGHLLWAATTRHQGGTFAAATFGQVQPRDAAGMHVVGLTADNHAIGAEAARLLLERLQTRTPLPVRHKLVPMHTVDRA